MGYLLNKLNPTSSTSGGDGDGPTSIVQLLAVFAAALVLVSSAGPVAAATSGFSFAGADDLSYDKNAGASTGYHYINVSSAASGDTVQVTINPDSDTSLDVTSTSNWQAYNTSEVSVSNVTQTASGNISYTLTFNTNVTTSSSYAIYGYYDVQDSGTATISNSLNTDTTSFSYSEPQGTIEVTGVTNQDGKTIDNYSVQVIDSNGTIVASIDNASGTYSTQVASGETYDVEVNADNYQPSSKSVAVNYSQTSSVNFSLSPVKVDYEFTVMNGDKNLSSFDISIYKGTIGDNETALQSVSVNDSETNTVTFTNLAYGQEYTVQVTYDNGTTYTYSFYPQVDSDRVIQETIDVSSDDSFGFIGSASDYSLTDVAMYIGGAFIVISTIIGGLFIFLWTKNGLKLNNF